MALFIAERIRKREFGREISAADKETLLKGARVCLRTRRFDSLQEFVA